MSASAPGVFHPGALVAGRYEVERKVGEGAFAEVWDGRDRRTGRRVALKRLRKWHVPDDELVARFQREAYFLSRVDSEHVAKIGELVVDPGFEMVLAMEFIEGHLLSTLMARTLLSIEEAIELGCDVLRGVRDLHAARIIHRDIKPSNIILRPLAGGDHFRAVIFDFSLSRLAERPSSTDPGQRPFSPTPTMNPITKGNVTLGTLEYMAPEQLLNSHEVDERSDLYSVGAILYAAVIGEHPFAEHEDLRDLARAKLTREAPPLATGRSDALTIAFEAVLAKALSRRPALRHASASEMLEDLERLRALAGDWHAQHDGLVARASAGHLRAARHASRGSILALRTSYPSFPGRTSPTPPAPTAEPAPPEASRSEGPKAVHRGLVLVAMLALVCVVGAAWSLWAFAL